MAGIVHVAAAQMGPIAKSETRKQTVNRLIAMMREAKERGCELVVFTEMALTTFFPRWLITDEAELDGYYEKEMPEPATQPLFDEAKKLGIGFYLGFAKFMKMAESAASTPPYLLAAMAKSSERMMSISITAMKLSQNKVAGRFMDLDSKNLSLKTSISTMRQSYTLTQ